MIHPVNCCGETYDHPAQHTDHLYAAHSACDMATEIAKLHQHRAAVLRLADDLDTWLTTMTVHGIARLIRDLSEENDPT